MTEFWQHIRYALRKQRLSPAFSLLIVVTLGLGIGANTAIFTVVHSVLLRPLPYDDPGQLVILWETEKSTGRELSFSYPNFQDWRQQSSAIAEMAAYGAETFTLTGELGGDKVAGEWVSEGYFSTLGVSPEVGRWFSSEEHATKGAFPITVISYSLWQRRFGSDRDIIGESLSANGVPLTIIGVAPQGFRGFDGKADLFVPIAMFEELLPHLRPYGILEGRATRWLQAFGRRAPGIALAGARDDLQGIASRLEQEYPKANEDKGADLADATERLVGDLRSSLLSLAAAVGFVLLIACVNVTNLLLARGVARQREVALRLALGSGRGSLARQLLVESFLLALMGGLLGVLLVYWGIDTLVALAPVEIPSYVNVGVNLPVLGFTLALSLIASVLFSLGPLLEANRSDLFVLLKEGNPVLGGSRAVQLRRFLVIAEITITLVLLVCAGLMLKSFERVRQFETGFEAGNLLTVKYDLPFEGYSEAERVGLKQQVLERLLALTPVRSVALTSHILFGAGYLTTGVVPEGERSETAQEPRRVHTYYVSPEYFKTLGIPLLRGRDFTDQDDASANVVIISAALAEQEWNGENPVGQRLRSAGDSENPWLTVVGVVGDVKTRIAPGEPEDPPEIYLPGLHDPAWGFSLVAKTVSSPLPTVPTFRRTLQEIDRNIPIFDIATLEQRMAEDTSQTRFFTLMMSLFAGLALTLAVIGIYGVISYSVTQRRREIGMRVALGARGSSILKLVIGDGMRLTAYGLVLGTVASFVITKTISDKLFNVSATDPATFIVMPLLLALIALLACLLPAWRAARTDPLISLRYE